MKRLIMLFVISIVFVNCAPKEEESVDDSSDYRSCYVLDQQSSTNICYDFDDAGASHATVAYACTQFSGTPASGACDTSYNSVGSVGLCTGITLSDGGSNTFTNVKARYYISADAANSQQAACVGESGTWNAGQ